MSVHISRRTALLLFFLLWIPLAPGFFFAGQGMDWGQSFVLAINLNLKLALLLAFFGVILDWLLRISLLDINHRYRRWLLFHTAIILLFVGMEYISRSCYWKLYKESPNVKLSALFNVSIEEIIPDKRYRVRFN